MGGTKWNEIKLKKWHGMKQAVENLTANKTVIWMMNKPKLMGLMTMIPVYRLYRILHLKLWKWNTINGWKCWQPMNVGWVREIINLLNLIQLGPFIIIFQCCHVVCGCPWISINEISLNFWVLSNAQSMQSMKCLLNQPSCLTILPQLSLLFA